MPFSSIFSPSSINPSLSMPSSVSPRSSPSMFRAASRACFRASSHGSLKAGRDDTFIAYRAELVPPVWLLTRRTQSRIFQHISVPDILKKVFEGFAVTYRIQGTFHPRDYCVQYRETDFDFAARLMQEEGIYFYFRHTADGCEMVLANTPSGHDPIPAPDDLDYDEIAGGNDDLGRVTSVGEDSGSPLWQGHALGSLLRTPAASAPRRHPEYPGHSRGRAGRLTS